jgi:hypothetical protein
LTRREEVSVADRVDDIKARLAAATPGPWRVAHHGAWEVEAPPNQLVADCGTVDHAKADANLIAHAPADIRWCLDRIAKLERAAEQVVDAWTGEGWSALRSVAAGEAVDALRTVLEQPE